MTIGGNPLCDAMAFDGFRLPLKCESYRIKISIVEIRIIIKMYLSNFHTKIVNLLCLINQNKSHRKPWSHSWHTPSDCRDSL